MSLSELSLFKNFEKSKSAKLDDYKPPPRIDCRLCFENVSIEDCLTLDCEHKFCKDCLVANWTVLVNSSLVHSSSLKCPEADCNAPITYEQLRGKPPKSKVTCGKLIFSFKANLDSATFLKYERIAFEQYEIENQHEIGFTCPNQNCKKRSTIWSGADFIHCHFCKIKYCTHCRLEYHPEATCQEAIENKDMTEEEKKLRIMMKTEGWRECPVCKEVIVKEEGCQFMRCLFNNCFKKTYFCYLCGVRLEASQHYDHYVGRNPYGDKCLNRSEAPSAPEEIELYPCPQCFQPSKHFGLSERFFVCSNENCKVTVFCASCKRPVKDSNFDRHSSCSQGTSCNVF